MVKHPEQLSGSPVGEEIISHAVRIMGGAEQVAQELVNLFNEAASPTVRKDILKTIVMGSIAAAKGKPKTDVSAMSDKDLNEAIEAKLVDLHQKIKQRELAPKLDDGKEPGTNDPGLQPID